MSLLTLIVVVLVVEFLAVALCFGVYDHFKSGQPFGAALKASWRWPSRIRVV